MRVPQCRLYTLMIAVAFVALILVILVRSSRLQRELAQAAARVRVLRAEAMLRRFKEDAALERRIDAEFGSEEQALYRSHVEAILQGRIALGLRAGEEPLHRVHIEAALKRAYEADLKRRAELGLLRSNRR